MPVSYFTVDLRGINDSEKIIIIANHQYSNCNDPGCYRYSIFIWFPPTPILI